MNESGITNIFKTSDVRVLKYAKDNLKLYKIFGKQYKKECVSIYVIDYINHFFRCKQLGKFRPLLIFIPFIRYPIYTLNFLYNRIYKHFIQF